MTDIQKEYAGKSQAEIHQRICDMTAQILKLRKTYTYGEQARLQMLRQRRAQLQELLNKPTLVWSAG